MDWLLFIARKRGHGIEEDQCVNTAFLMQGFAWVAALLPPPTPDYWRCATPRAGSGPATFRNARSIPPRPRAPCARALSTGRVCAGGIHREHVGAGVRPKARMLSASCHLPTRPSRRDVSSRALLGAWQTPGAPAGHMAVSGPGAQLSRSIHAATADLARRCLARRKAQNEGRYDQSNNHEKRQHIPLRRYPICSPRFSRRTRKLRWSCSETGPASRRAGA